MYRVTVLPGDGIGPEIVKPAIEVLKKTAKKYDFEVEIAEELIGGIAIDKTGVPLPDKTVESCKNSNAVLLGSVGGPKWDGRADGIRPEQGLLGIRQKLDLFANLRPAIVYKALKDSSPLKPAILGDGLDIMIVRELTGGIYFGKSGRDREGSVVSAFDTEKYTVPEIERIAHVAFEIAEKRNKKLCSVDKANVLESSRLWRETVIRVATEFPDVELSHMYVDNAAMQLIRDPHQFDVVLTNNIFGDILSDAASQITGSIGMLPSASLGKDSIGLYEPIHGSAPDIAGKDIANPIATVLSIAMMLDYSLGQPQAARDIENAVNDIINSGARTADLGGKIGTKEMGKMILDRI